MPRVSLNFHPKIINQLAFITYFKLDTMSLNANTLVMINEIAKGRIVYSSMMDGEDKRYLTWVCKAKDEYLLMYRKMFLMTLVIQNDTN